MPHENDLLVALWRSPETDRLHCSRRLFSPEVARRRQRLFPYRMVKFVLPSEARKVGASEHEEDVTP